MTTFNLTCEAVEATLPDYLDETLEPWVRTSIEEHLGECARCAGLARELRNITREASVLPSLVPEREIWPRIAGRIGDPASVSAPVAESAPLMPIPEPMVFASDASLPISEPLEVTSEPLVVKSEPLVVKSEPLVVKSEPLVVTGVPRELADLPVWTSEPLELADLPVRTREPPGPPVLTSDLPKPLLVTREPELAAGRTVPVPITAPAHAALPARHEKRQERWRMGLAAAALMLVTAGTTSLLTIQWLGRARTPNLASETGVRKPSSSERPGERGIRAPSVGREQVATDSSALTPPTGQLVSALTMSATSVAEVTPSPEDVVYDKEIKTLQRIVRRQKAELDPSAVAVIEKNLRTLDSAIAQIRAALQKDPGSPVLGGQASRALEMKVELLRRAAMLRSST